MKNRTIIRALIKYWGGKPRRPKCAILLVHMSELRCPLKILARRPDWGRSLKTFFDCRKLLK